MAPWCIYISCIERVARCGSGRDNVRGVVGTMNAARSRPDWLATVQSGRKQVQSRVCTPGFKSSVALRQNKGCLQRTVAPCVGANVDSSFINKAVGLTHRLDSAMESLLRASKGTCSRASVQGLSRHTYSTSTGR